MCKFCKSCWDLDSMSSIMVSGVQAESECIDVGNLGGITSPTLGVCIRRSNCVDMREPKPVKRTYSRLVSLFSGSSRAPVNIYQYRVY
jgi:hypothetical protein